MEMELDFDDANFWLPSEFLKDDDEDEMKTGKPVTGSKGMSILNGFGSFGLDSDLSSPVESVMGSTETESDEEEYLNELTRKLANSALDENDDDDNFSKPEIKSTRVLAGSPQSTLIGYKEVSVNGNGKSDCRLPLPPVTGNRNQIAPQPPRRIPNPNPNPQFHQIQLKQQQMMKQRQQQYEEMVRRSRMSNGVGGGMVAAPLSGWPTLQQSQQKLPGMGMRAVFLGNPNTKRESTGTGVFLPRQVGAPIETRKKKGCSTVLLPEKVIQALNLNVEAQTRSNVGRFPHHYDVEMRNRNNVMMAEPRRQQGENDLRLPQEWTY